ncbi:hypothetical protein PROFUN_11727, partial [Planoprotostelium fungivorum]
KMNSWNLVLIECASLRGAPNCNIRTRAVVTKEASIAQKPSKSPSVAPHPSQTDDNSTSHVNTDTVLRSASVAPIASAGKSGWDHPSFHLNTNTPANTGPFSNTRKALQRAAANNRMLKLTSIIATHFGTIAYGGTFAREKHENYFLPRPAQTSAEIQRDTISDTDGSDTQNRVSEGNLSHLQLRLLSTTTRVTLHLRHDCRMFDAHLWLPWDFNSSSQHTTSKNTQKDSRSQEYFIQELQRLRLVPPFYEEPVIVSAGERICSSDKEVLHRSRLISNTTHLHENPPETESPAQTSTRRPPTLCRQTFTPDTNSEITHLRARGKKLSPRRRLRARQRRHRGDAV